MSDHSGIPMELFSAFSVITSYNYKSHWNE